MADPDPLLRRIERDTIVACVVMAAAAGILSRAHLSAAAGVAAGGALAWISYHGITSGIAAAAGGIEGRRRAAGLVKFFTRYAILAIVAYVAMARFGLPPVAVIAGASSLVIAIAVEAVRQLRQ